VRDDRRGARQVMPAGPCRVFSLSCGCIGPLAGQHKLQPSRWSWEIDTLRACRVSYFRCGSFWSDLAVARRSPRAYIHSETHLVAPGRPGPVGVAAASLLASATHRSAGGW